jgi:CHASE3 domain sensor protein
MLDFMYIHKMFFTLLLLIVLTLLVVGVVYASKCKVESD